jgi:hypothetical protein
LLLDKIVDDFPYFQSARALRLKNLYNQDSFKYNYALKVTASHTTDRSVLFEYITSQQFVTIQKVFFEEKNAKINDIIVNDSIVILGNSEQKPTINKLEQSIITSINEATPISVANVIMPISISTINEKLDIGKPLDFSKSEKHSFQEWLQLSNFNTIIRTETPTKNSVNEVISPEKKKKSDLIDRFIEANPKIPPVKSSSTIAIVSEQNAQENSYLMTETLAKVYLEQKKYQKAIQAFEILILKYPEKFSFFADRISDIKILQQNNN